MFILNVDPTLDPIIKYLSEVTDHDFTTIGFADILVRILLAVIVGGLIGSERASKHHVAGLRTYILVCLGSCICMLINELISDTSDVARLGAGVITGIGFLGAGSIMMNSRNQVRGLTTAAALWANGAIGLAIGIGFYTIAIISALVIIIALVFLPKVEFKIQSKSKIYELHVELLSRTDLKKLLDFVRSKHVEFQSITYDSSYANTGLSVYSIALKADKVDGKYMLCCDLVDELENLDYVNHVKVMD